MNSKLRRRRKNSLWEKAMIESVKRGRGKRVFCAICESPIMVFSEATIDHIKPKSLGGASDLSNLQLAHKFCNEKKGNAYTEEDHKHH